MSVAGRDKKDVVHCLPAEIWIRIFESSPSFSALWSITRTTSGLAAIFGEHAVQIVEAVMQSTEPRATRAYLKAVLCMRLCSFSCSSLAEAKDVQYTTANSSLTITGTAKLDAVRGFVLLAHKIHVLAHEGMEHYIQKCMAISPSRFDAVWLDRRNPRIFPEGEKYQPLNVGLPSWVEEKTLLLTLWRLQYRLELLAALHSGLLRWDTAETMTLTSSSAAEFYGHVRSWEREQIITISEYLQALREDCGTALSWLPNPIEMNKFDFGCSSDRPTDSAGSSFPGKTTPVACRMVAWMSSDIKLSPTPGITYAAFRKFGFVLWDERRMVGLGLYPAEKVIPGRQYYLRWRSILSDEETAGVQGTERGSIWG